MKWLGHAKLNNYFPQRNSVQIPPQKEPDHDMSS